ncbi:hypothetical protein ACLKA7_013625 [Drosophila subpalustris]
MASALYERCMHKVPRTTTVAAISPLCLLSSLGISQRFSNFRLELRKQQQHQQQQQQQQQNSSQKRINNVLRQSQMRCDAMRAKPFWGAQNNDSLNDGDAHDGNNMRHFNEQQQQLEFNPPLPYSRTLALCSFVAPHEISTQPGSPSLKYLLFWLRVKSEVAAAAAASAAGLVVAVSSPWALVSQSHGLMVSRCLGLCVDVGTGRQVLPHLNVNGNRNGTA